MEQGGSWAWQSSALPSPQKSMVPKPLMSWSQVAGRSNCNEPPIMSVTMEAMLSWMKSSPPRVIRTWMPFGMRS